MTSMTHSPDSRPTTSRPTPSSFARIPASFRLQFSVPSVMIGVPTMVFLVSWAIGVAILAWIVAQFDPGEPVYALGATQSTIWTLAFLAGYAASHSFPFSLALSYSRRLFVTGAFLAFAAVSAGFGAAFALAALIERLTGGFWMDAYVFDVPLLTESAGLVGVGVLAAVVCLFFMMFGFFWAILYRRVSLVVLWAVILALAVVVVAAAVLVTQFEGWPGLWNWFLSETTLTLAAWLFPAALVLAGINYAVIRRAR